MTTSELLILALSVGKASAGAASLSSFLSMLVDALGLDAALLRAPARDDAHAGVHTAFDPRLDDDKKARIDRFVLSVKASGFREARAQTGITAHSWTALQGGYSAALVGSVEIGEDAHASLRAIFNRLVLTIDEADPAPAAHWQKQRWDLAASAAGIGLWELDIRSRTLLWDAWSHRIFNVPESAFGNRFDDWAQCLVAEDLEQALEDFSHALKAGDSFETEYRIHTHPGELRHIRGVARVERDEAGNAIRLVGINHDITDLKNKTQELLRRSQLESLLMQVSLDLLNTEIDHIDTCLNAAIRQVGAFVGADRCYVFHYDWAEGTCSNSYEWCAAGIDPQIQNLQDISLDLVPEWVQAHLAGEVFQVPEVSRLNAQDPMRDILQRQGIQSVIAFPLVSRERKALGFVGFDAVRKPRQWNEGEIKLLTLFGNLLASAEVRRQHEGRLRDAHVRVKEALAEAQAAEESARNASQAKSRFLASMSHEIRTPMNVIIGAADVLQKAPLDSHHQKFLDALNVSSRALLNIIDDILDSAKLEEGRLGLNECAFSLREVMQEAFGLFKDSAAAKGVELSWAMDREVPDHQWGDPNRVRQVIVNLLSNAVKFTARGSIRLTAGLVEKHGSQVEIRVRDTGPGIDAASCNALFQPFSQVDQSLTRPHGGAGLGLWITQQLCVLMGGEVGVISTEGEGSIFWVRLPLKPVENPATIVTQGVARRQRFEGRRILLAEDQTFNQLLAKELLSRLGCEVTVVGNGREAVELADRERFDAVLMDCRMPVMDGFEAARRLRQLRHGAGVPILAVTANAMAEDREHCLAAGMDDVLAKPYDQSQLCELLGRWIT
ncbi:MAG: response regulator [Proteobacteria bacterium]|nr:response regulator [Pseudomonadota bacterium]